MRIIDPLYRLRAFRIASQAILIAYELSSVGRGRGRHGMMITSPSRERTLV